MSDDPLERLRLEIRDDIRELRRDISESEDRMIARIDVGHSLIREFIIEHTRDHAPRLVVIITLLALLGALATADVTLRLP